MFSFSFMSQSSGSQVDFDSREFRVARARWRSYSSRAQPCMSFVPGEGWIEDSSSAERDWSEMQAEFQESQEVAEQSRAF